MGEYKINYIQQPSDDLTNSSHPMEEGMSAKEAFWDCNLSIHSCIAMILGADISLNTDERGLYQYRGSIDFIILYDVLHGIYNRNNFKP